MRQLSSTRKGWDFPEWSRRLKLPSSRSMVTWLELYGREALAGDATVSPEGSGFESFTLAHNVHSEKEVDEVVSQAVGAGATLVKGPRKVFWGGDSGYFKYLDGHLWEVACNPLFWVGPTDENA
jgi:uncharacterized protein